MSGSKLQPRRPLTLCHTSEKWRYWRITLKPDGSAANSSATTKHVCLDFSSATQAGVSIHHTDHSNLKAFCFASTPVWNVYNLSAERINILHIVSIFTFWKPPKLPGVGGNLSVVGFHRKECRATGRIGEAGHCRVSAFQLDSSHPPTSSGLGSQWRLSKPMVRVSQVYGVLGVDKVSVSALNQWRKAKVLTSHSLTGVNY